MFNLMIIGQSSYDCIQDNMKVEYTLTYSSHSAENLSSNCSLSQCFNGSSDCRISSTPCFDYRTANNESYCAPASLCSILETCHNQTGECSSQTSVCIINSCCSPKSVCLPIQWTSLCSASPTRTTTGTEIVFF